MDSGGFFGPFSPIGKRAEKEKLDSNFVLKRRVDSNLHESTRHSKLSIVIFIAQAIIGEYLGAGTQPNRQLILK
ncbi:hypothetical protein [Algoriphagus zhangzhouensis]|uniref:hypothetical protein n=1 Tax=Algoriphagus zhangzhouensis TaxID=1073327 RepID=UPI000935DA4B|nr:hypothetical protein [Algoriphagus zhangzhouensis]